MNYMCVTNYELYMCVTNYELYMCVTNYELEILYMFCSV